MFRFIHAADPHLDSPLRGLSNREDAPVQALRGATRRAFANLVSLALLEKVDFLLIAGDLYDGDWKDYSTGLFFRSQMVRLLEANIPVYLISGNHDAASVITRKLPLPGNVHLFSTRAPETKTIPNLPVAIHGRGFPQREVPENIALDYPAALPGICNIGLLHTSLTGRLGHDTYAPCTERDLRSKGYDYWALGHIHQPEIVSEEPWIVFAGNCQGRHARETGPRGCRLVTVEDDLRVASAEWRSLDVVRWSSIDISLDGAAAEDEALQRVKSQLQAAVAAAEGRLLAARLVLVGSTALHGNLHRDAHAFRAKIEAIAQDLGSDALWIEQVKLASTPVYDLAELASRDALTRTVLESLDAARRQTDALPSEIADMLEILPPDLRSETEAEWQDGPFRDALLQDVRSIVLEALATKGDGHT